MRGLAKYWRSRDVIITYGDDQSAYPHPAHQVKKPVLAWEGAVIGWYPALGGDVSEAEAHTTPWGQGSRSAIHSGDGIRSARRIALRQGLASIGQVTTIA